MTSLPLARVFRALFRFVLIGGNLTAQLKESHRELKAEFIFQRRSASSPSFSRPAARVPRRACPVLESNGLQYVIFISLRSTSDQLKVKKRRMAKPWAFYNNVFLYTFEVQIEVSMKGSSLQIH